MARFTPKKIVLGDINKGIEFTESDGVTPNAINDPIEAVAYAQTVVEHLTDTPDTSEINGTGSPNVSFVSDTTADGVTIHKFKFSNLSGATFTPSLDEAGNLSWSNNRNLPNPPTINISGRDYLFSSEVLSGTYIPQVNSEVTDMPLTSFNRAPVDDIDHCYLFYYYTPENIYYWLATQVVDIQKTTATLKILSVVRLTGYTPTIGKNGNWFIGGDDTGKPSYGASGVTDVVAGDSRTQNGYTITPLTFNFEVGNSKTVNVKAAVGNVEDGSYAKLAQVVRVDAAQSLTDAQKTQAQNNMGLDNKYAKQTGKYPNLKSGGNTVVDTRSVNSPPSYYADQETCYEFKSRDTLGLADYMPNSAFVLLTTKKGWVDNNYVVYQEAVSAGNDPSSVTDSVKCYRYGLGETWGEWQVVAKTSQVVRTDTAQTLTDEQKQQAQNNIAITVTKETSSGEQTGWWRVAQISQSSVYDIKLKQSFNTNSPAQMNVVANVGYMDSTNAVLSLISGFLASSFTVTKIRVCGNTTACYIDIYTPDATWNKTVVEIKGASGSSISQTEFSFVGTSDTVDGYNVVILDLVSGANTSGQIYQQGNPVATKSELNYISNSEAQIASAGWHTVAQCNKLNGAAAFITVQQQYNAESPNSINLSFAQTGYGTPVLNCLGVAGTLITKARYVRPTEGKPGLIQIYYNSSGTNYWYCSVISAQKGDVTAYLDPVATTSDTSIQPSVTINTPGGCSISTSSNIYANGSPVLVGSIDVASGSLESLTLPSAGWYYIRYRFTDLLAIDYATGVFYWGKRQILLPISYYNAAKTSRCLKIGSDGVITAYDPETGGEVSGGSATYYKLA